MSSDPTEHSAICHPSSFANSTLLNSHSRWLDFRGHYTPSYAGREATTRGLVSCHALVGLPPTSGAGCGIARVQMDVRARGGTVARASYPRVALRAAILAPRATSVLYDLRWYEVRVHQCTLKKWPYESESS